MYQFNHIYISLVHLLPAPKKIINTILKIKFNLIYFLFF